MKNSGIAARGRAALFLLVGLILLMTVISAAVIVIRNAARIQPVEVPVHLRLPPPDVGLRRFRSSTRTRLRNAESRFERYRAQVNVPTAEQESLVSVVEAELAGTRAELEELDSLVDVGTRRELDRRRQALLERRQELFNTVSAYVRTVLMAREGPELEALERELEWLLRDE